MFTTLFLSADPVEACMVILLFPSVLHGEKSRETQSWYICDVKLTL